MESTFVFPSPPCIRHTYYFSKILKDLRPRYVVLYDPNVNCIRQLEVYKAMNPGVPLRVYVLFYDSSVEEQVNIVERDG